MATKMLNLDEIETGTEKAFTYKGKKHIMRPLSVAEYVKQLKTLETLKAGDKADVESHVDFMVDSIVTAFPTITREEVESMDMERIQMLAEHVNSEVEEETTEGNV